MKYDHIWLEAYAEMLQGKTVLELGCGSGIDTVIINKCSDSLISGDIATKFNQESSVLNLDHSKELPFEAGTFDLVVASLCLHYFTFENTRNIVAEISRVMKPASILICRVNSYKDTNFGSVGYPEIEPGLYNVNGEQKRFFKEKDIHTLWAHSYKLSDILHKRIDRYNNPKYVYEFNATKA